MAVASMRGAQEWEDFQTFSARRFARVCGLSLHDVADAARRIAGRVRQVPVIPGDREGL
jgi:hypothetical protein